jgi:hypothetical protein
MLSARFWQWFQLSSVGVLPADGLGALNRAQTRRPATRTGGPDDDDGDDDEQLRRLMPILAGVIAVAVIFGG